MVADKIAELQKIERITKEERIARAEGIIEQLADVVLNDSQNEFEVARLAYELAQLRISWRDMAAALGERGVNVSYSWLYRLGTIYEWWVVIHGYSPDALAKWTKTKLYFMAREKLSDVELLEKWGHLSDTQFAGKLREELGLPQTTTVISISAEVRKLIVSLADRLSEITGDAVSNRDALHFALEVVNGMSDEALKKLWLIAHGEYIPD